MGRNRTSRRQARIVHAMQAAWTLLFVLTVPAVDAAPPATKPNLLLIFVDDMGYADLGCCGGTLAPTPNIDALAASGVRCTDGYVTSPVCAPSRCGLMTGAYGQRFGMQWNEDQYRNHAYQIPDEHKLLPQALAAGGYATAHIGKWNVSRDVTEAFDEARGVMDWKGHYFAAEDGTFFGVDGTGADQINGATEPHGWGPELPGAAYLTDTLTDYAIDFINRHDQRREENVKPFFLYLAYNAVHSPWQAKRLDEPKYSHVANEPLRLYAAMLASLDDNIGRVLSRLKESGLEENTLVAFISDNGPAMGSAQIKGWKPEWPEEVLMGSASPLRGRKAQYYEGGIREPFILRWPDHLAAGTEYRRPVSTMDIYATFCAAAGVPIPDGTRLDGVNLLPYLLGEKSDSPHETLYWLSNDQGAVRRGDWKLVISPWQPKLQLFNLAEDVGETQDLAAERPDIRDMLLKAWSQWREPFPPRANPGLRKKPTQSAAATSPANGTTDTVIGVFSTKEMKNSAGESYVAYAVTTSDGHEYLIYYRLLKDKLAGRKPADFAGKEVRVLGVCSKTANGGTFSRLDSIRWDSDP
jgi:arylsulfatase A-like enzyme